MRGTLVSVVDRPGTFLWPQRPNRRRMKRESPSENPINPCGRRAALAPLKMGRQLSAPHTLRLAGAR